MINLIHKLIILQLKSSVKGKGASRVQHSEDKEFQSSTPRDLCWPPVDSNSYKGKVILYFLYKNMSFEWWKFSKA